MSRRMSCALTADAVRDRSKTVTRRQVDTWGTLKAGDRLTLIEKGMGLAKGEKQVVLAQVEVVASSVISLFPITPAELIAEGFPGADPYDWCVWWAESHRIPAGTDLADIECRRIEWRYLDDERTAS